MKVVYIMLFSFVFPFYAQSSCIEKMAIQVKILKNNIEAIRISGGVDFSPNSELNKIVEKNLAELQEIKTIISYYRHAKLDKKNALSVMFFEKLELFNIDQKAGKESIISILEDKKHCEIDLLTEPELYELIVSKN